MISMAGVAATILGHTDAVQTPMLAEVGAIGMQVVETATMTRILVTGRATVNDVVNARKATTLAERQCVKTVAE